LLAAVFFFFSLLQSVINWSLDAAFYCVIVLDLSKIFKAY